MKNIEENRADFYEFRFISPDKSQSVTHTLRNVTLVNFHGSNEFEKVEVIISNSLIHQYIAVRQRGYKYYVSFYLKESASYEHLRRLIWILDELIAEIDEKLNSVNEI